ncbi:hypothetical protein [Streptomyces viridosporus]|uniref:hypothetical protein n=1 Tax=Streptomyces viridosporus TaxID=67581 RepID=UPI00117F51BE
MSYSAPCSPACWTASRGHCGRALAEVLAAPGTPAFRPLCREPLDVLLARESDTGVLDAVLRTATRSTGPELRFLVHRTGLLPVRAPEGAARFDRAPVDPAHHVPGFAAAVADWSAEAPREWAVVVGPGARRTIEDLTGAGTPG